MPTVRILAGQSHLFQIYQQQCPAKTPKKGESPVLFMLSVRINQWFPNGGEFGTFQGGIAHMFCHFYMIKVPLVSIFQITNFGKGEYKKWYYKRGELEKKVWEPLV